MNGNYANQAEIDKVQKILYDISPILKIAWYGLKHTEDYVFEVGVKFPLKGNAEIVKKLKDAGFRKRRTYKVETASIWSENADYSFWIDMEIKMPNPPKEDT